MFTRLCHGRLLILYRFFDFLGSDFSQIRVFAAFLPAFRSKPKFSSPDCRNGLTALYLGQIGLFLTHFVFFTGFYSFTCCFVYYQPEIVRNNGYHALHGHYLLTPAICVFQSEAFLQDAVGPLRNGPFAVFDPKVFSLRFFKVLFLLLCVDRN